MRRKKRCLIYAYYDINGIVHNSTVKILAEFRRCVDYIFFVSNCKIANFLIIKPYTDKIIERENKGYDAGAYGEVLNSSFFQKSLSQIDQVILCNSSFWGPFIPLKSLFSKMEERKSDFWGLAYSGKGFAHHLQSYFIVFEEQIIKSGLLNQYFRDYILEKANDYNEVCRNFEIGLSDFLLSKGFACDAYVKGIRFDPYANPYGSVKYDGLPIIKKKVFAREFFDEDQAQAVLALVKEKYGVDIHEIREEAEKLYMTKFSRECVKKNILINAEINQNIMLKSWEEIKSYINSKNNICILGCGHIMHQVVNHFFSSADSDKLERIIAIGKINELTKSELQEQLQDYMDCPVLICVDGDEVEASFDSLNLKDSFNVWKDRDEYIDNTVSVTDNIVFAMGKYFYYHEPLAIIDDDGYYCGMLTKDEMEKQYTLAEDTSVLAIANISVEGFTDICRAREFASENRSVAPLVDHEGKFIKFLGIEQNALSREDLTKEIIRNIVKRKVVLWGTGRKCMKYITRASDFPIAFCIDNDETKRNTRIEGVLVKHASDVDDWKQYFIIITPVKGGEIRKQLESYGLKYAEDFAWGTDVF